MDNVVYFDLISDESLIAIIGERFFLERFLPEYRRQVDVIHCCDGHFYYLVSETIYVIFKLLNNGNESTSIPD